MPVRHRKNVVAGSVAAGLVVAFAVAVAAQRPPTRLPSIDVINQIKARTPGVIADALKGIKLPPPAGTSAACKADFDAAVKAAEAEATGCLNFDTAPANSPIGEFKANELAAEAKFCQNAATAGACAQAILDAQAKFCAKERAKDQAKANIVRKRCEAEVQQCALARSELQKTKDEILRLQRLLPSLEQKAAKECP